MQTATHGSAVPALIGAPTLRQSGRVLLFATGYVATSVGLIVAVLLVTSASPSPFVLLVMIGGGVGAAVLTAIRVHLVRRDGVSLTALGFARPSRGLLHLLWQVPMIMIACATVTMIVVGVLLQQQPAGGNTVGEVAASAAWPTLVALLLVTAVLTPLWEEVVFRGLLFSSLTRHLPMSVAAILSSAAFAVIHVVPVVMPYLFLLGLGACWLYARHRTLWAPIALHATNNAVIALVAGLP